MKKNPSFEDQLARLEEINGILGDEETPLEQSIALYKEAANLLRSCRAMLEGATLQVEEIDASLAAGETDAD